ncbi:phosphatase yitU [Mycobacteroides abscessus subsp. abscessus]|nr:phosphatase yitU [Mycobacteroides abscessus subsp. abscessus]
MYKLLAIDIDRTLLNDRKEVTKEVNEAIQAAKRKGVKVVICTGRPIGGVHEFIEELDLHNQFVITFNGALVQHSETKEVLSEISLTHEDLLTLYKVSQELETSMHFSDTQRIYTPNKDISPYTVLESFVNNVPLHYREMEEVPTDILIPKVMFAGDPEQLDKTIASIPIELKEKYTMVRSTPYFYEILHPSVSKGNAVKLLAEKLGIAREEVICIGDGENDLTMIEYAGCGVAMGNAVSTVKEIAQFHTHSNNEHGVAYAIEQLILNNNDGCVS